MKRLVIASGIILSIAFILITVQKKDNKGPAPPQKGGSVVNNEKKRTIDDFWSVFKRAEGLGKKGDLKGAVEYYNKALKIDPGHETSLYRLGNLFSAMGRNDEAIRTFKKLIEINPVSVRARNRIGQILSTPQPGVPLDLKGARVQFEEALELNSEESGTLYWMGKILIEQGKYKEGREYLVNATRFNPDHTGALGLLAYTYMLEGGHSKAAEYYARALAAGTKKAGPQDIPGEGDTKESLKDSSVTSSKKIGALFGLAVASRAAGGYAPDVPEQFRVKLPDFNKDLLETAPTAGAKITLKGSASAWVDFDKDRDKDLLLVGPDTPLRLLKNDGNFQFTDVTEKAGLAKAGNGRDVLTVDFDVDGDEDIYLLRSRLGGSRESLLFRNDHGVFIDVTAAAGLSKVGSLLKAEFADLNSDTYPEMILLGLDKEQRPEVRIYTGSKDGFRLLWKDNPPGDALPVDCAIGDFTGDSLPDIFILRWRAKGVLYKNLGNGDFTDVTEKSGLDAEFRGLSVLSLDYNNDGAVDIFVGSLAPYDKVLRSVLGLETVGTDTEMDRGHPVLYANKGGGVFERITDSGLAGFYGTLDAKSVDVNSDGLPDIYLANGGFETGRFEPDALLVNTGGQGGKLFTNVYMEPAPPKSLRVSTSAPSPSNDTGSTAAGSYLFVARGGFVPGENKSEGVIYLIPQRDGSVTLHPSSEALQPDKRRGAVAR